MSVSKKYLCANQENAKKGGVKTAAGKTIIRHTLAGTAMLGKGIVLPKANALKVTKNLMHCRLACWTSFAPEFIILKKDTAYV